MAQVLSIISIISFIVAGLAFLLAVFFWFKFKIPSVIGDLSGRTARKSIAKMRQNSENAGKKEVNATTLLSYENIATTLLADTNNETTLLAYENNETSLLINENNETTLLVADAKVSGSGVSKNHFVMLDEIMLIHTNEVIV